MGELNGKTFFKEFIKRVNSEENDMIETYKNYEREWTPYIINLIKEIICNYGIVAQKEYYRIDVIGWQGGDYSKIKEKANELKLNDHLWNLKIAVEHENSKKDWTDELIKLCHIRCPLKVIIGYTHCENRDKTDKEKLHHAAYCLNMIEAFKESNDEVMLILGNGSIHKKTTYEHYGYRGYIYNRLNDCFEEII